MLIVQADTTHLPLRDRCVDLVFGSPPYTDARTYGIGAQRDCAEWVDWMLEVTMECQRVCRGPVIWVAANVTRGRNYQPACEGLMWQWWRRGGDCHLYRPCIFHRRGIPGSGGTDWFRADTEYILCFKRPGELSWADNTAMGHPPKWAPGAEMSHRLSDGSRVNQWGHSYDSGATVTDGEFVRSKGKRPSHRLQTKGRNQWGGTSDKNRKGTGNRKADGRRDNRWRPSHRYHTKRRADGSMERQGYDAPVLANPGNFIEEPIEDENPGDVIHANVGGGHMGHPAAHRNEAPFPEKLPEWFIRSLCPPGGTVLDPFSGSGTTIAVAQRLGRVGIGMDLRFDQCHLSSGRLNCNQLELCCETE